MLIPPRRQVPSRGPPASGSALNLGAWRPARHAVLLDHGVLRHSPRPYAAAGRRCDLRGSRGGSRISHAEPVSHLTAGQVGRQFHTLAGPKACNQLRQLRPNVRLRP